MGRREAPGWLGLALDLCGGDGVGDGSLWYDHVNVDGPGLRSARDRQWRHSAYYGSTAVPVVPCARPPWVRPTVTAPPRSSFCIFSKYTTGLFRS